MKVSNLQWQKIILIGLTVFFILTAVCAGLLLANVYTVDVALQGEAEITVEYGSAFTDPSATAVYYGSIFQRKPLNVPVNAEGKVDLSKVGTYEIRYSAQHEGITGSAVRTVRVVDTVKPEISLLGDAAVTLPVGTAFEEPGCTASDNYSGDLTAHVAVSGTLDAAVPGTYTLTYTATDASGNSAQVRRTVTYVDVTAPVICLVGDSEIAIEPGSTYTELGYTAIDDCDGDVTAAITVSGTVDGNTPGAYTLTYSVTDAGGNTAMVCRTVTVRDIYAPVLTLLGDQTVEMTIGNGFSDPGYTAIDSCDGDVTDLVVVTSDINIYLPGTYTVTYTVTDSAGNTAEQTRTVVLHDIQAQTPGGIIYLTYDDGPSGYTSQLLDILDSYGVKVTFFTVNSGYGGTMARAAASGHTVAIHSASHDYKKIYASEDAYFDDLYRMQSIIQSNTGVTSMLLRFPGGSSNTVSNYNPGIMTRLTRLVEEKGFRYFDWNVDSRDAGGVSSYAEAAYNVIRGISTRKTSVVLMHDSNGYCLRATARVIQWALDNGYTFAALTYDGPGCHHGVNN